MPACVCRYEQYLGTEQGDHLARVYNENALLTTLQVCVCVCVFVCPCVRVCVC